MFKPFLFLRLAAPSYSSNSLTVELSFLPPCLLDLLLFVSLLGAPTSLKFREDLLPYPLQSQGLMHLVYKISSTRRSIQRPPICSGVSFSVDYIHSIGFHVFLRSVSEAGITPGAFGDPSNNGTAPPFSPDKYEENFFKRFVLLSFTSTTLNKRVA
jgi:hypothetical protein